HVLTHYHIMPEFVNRAFGNNVFYVKRTIAIYGFIGIVKTELELFFIGMGPLTFKNKNVIYIMEVHAYAAGEHVNDENLVFIRRKVPHNGIFFLTAVLTGQC